MKLPKITVVTPSYNQAKYLEKTIHSVLNQQYSNLEYIVLDGGSTDGSADVIRKYEQSLAYWHSRPDDGQPAAINEGFKRASGEIYTYINSDDILLPGCLERVAREFGNNKDLGAVYGNIVYMDEESRPLWAYAPPTYVGWIARREFFLPQQGTFYRADLWERLGGVREDLGYAFDTEFWCRVIAAGATVKKIDSVLAGFRKHSVAKGMSQAWEERKTSQRSALDREFHNQSAVTRGAARVVRIGLQVASGNYFRRKFWRLKESMYTELIAQSEAAR